MSAEVEPRCWRCGLVAGTHPIETCREFVVPASTDRVEVQWGIDYRDGCGVAKADSEFRARAWVKHFNEHREDAEPALLMRREVVFRDWMAQ